MSRVVITGGSGFIGRWLVKKSLEEGHAVTVYDNLCVGRRSNLSEFDGHFEFVEADIRDEDSLAAAMKTARPEIVFHLAAHHFIPYCNAHPAETMRVNVEGSEIVARLAAQAGAERQRAVRGGEPVHVVDLAAGGRTSIVFRTIPGRRRHPFRRPRR